MFARASVRSIRNIRRVIGPSNARSVSTSSIFKQFDKSILYPTLLVVLLGSQIMKVMDAQASVDDLERRYNLKMDKIEELKTRIEQGEKFDLEKEMSLVNKLFERSNKEKQYLKSTSDKFGNKFGNQFGVKQRSHENLKDSDLFKDLDDDLTDEKLNKLLGLDPIPMEKNNKSQSNIPESSTLKPLSKDELQQQMENEKELLKFRLDPNTHVVMQQPGDYVSAAKDTKVSGFL